MNLGQRLSFAWHVLSGQKSVATMIETWRERQPVYSETSFPNMVKHGWRRNELIFACISKTANTASQVQMRITRDRDGEELSDHPLAQLIANPNPFMSEFDFWSAVIIYQKLAGGAYFEKERSRGGQVVRLWPLRPDWISPLASSKEMISGYTYAPPGLQPQFLEARDVLDFRLFDPLNMYRGWPPAAVAARVGDVDNAVTDYLKLFFEKGGTPPGLLKTVQKLDDGQVAGIRRRWRERYGGSEHWLEPAVLDSDASYQQIGMSFRDMGFDILDARNEARICMVLQVPPILVGAKMGLERATYSNYAEARKAWWQDDLMPLYANFQDVINGLAVEYDDGVSCSWDFSQVAAIQDERHSRWQRANDALRTGGILVNEYRDEIGMPRVAGGDIFLRSMTTVEVPAKANRKAVPAAPHEHKADSAPDDDERQRQERILRKAMAEYFDAQLGRIKKEAASGNLLG